MFDASLNSNAGGITNSSTYYSNTATYATTTADTSNSLYIVGVTSSATTTLKRDTSVTIKGGTVTATSFVGDLTGNADTATSATSANSATNSTNVYVTKTNPTSGTTYYLPWATGQGSANYGLNANDGLRYLSLEGTTSAEGYGRIILGNATASGTAANKSGWIRIYGNTAYYTDIKGGPVTANRTVTLPTFTASGHLLGKSTTSAVGSYTQPVYFTAAGIATAALKVTSGTADPSGGSSGDIYIQYAS